MIEAGKVYITTNKHFVSGVRDLSQQCRNDEVVSECLQKFGDSLQEMINYHMILFDQAQRSVRQQLHNFVKDDVRKFKETKKQFDKVREDMEMSLVKNAQAPRHRPHEVEEATGALTLTRKCFRHLALDYVLQINVLQAKKKFEILDAVRARLPPPSSWPILLPSPDTKFCACVCWAKARVMSLLALCPPWLGTCMPGHFYAPRHG
uniref:Arf-GAP with coiled-coil, ANK repeat and PH domain-containing protein n=1 Tax=Monodelphis domestica TaxID=13616 RepID=A0A5F8HB77_MONDO